MSIKILVADESPTIHKIVAMAFENEGITVEGISRGEHVMEYMVEYQPNIVLADVHLPGIDGYELCRQIKNFPSFVGIRVILLTSDFEDIDKLKLEVSKADDFISKPFKTEEILQKVKSQLNQAEPKEKAKIKTEQSSKKIESNAVIQNEFEDILNKPEKESSDPIQQFFDEDEKAKSSIDEIDLESYAPSKEKAEEAQQEKTQTVEKAGEVKKLSQDDSETDKEMPEIFADLPEEAFQAETRPIKISTDDLNAVFQSVLSSPESGLEDTPKLEPGSKPNLIEETLTFMARRKTGEKPESVTGDSNSNTLGNKIIKEHLDQVIKQLPEDVKQGNSHFALEKTVREVLGEVAPNIIRKVIQEEIETIKKMKEA